MKEHLLINRRIETEKEIAIASLNVESESTLYILVYVSPQMFFMPDPITEVPDNIRFCGFFGQNYGGWEVHVLCLRAT